ncbi:hypothetical protein [Thioalkalivibrio sp.]
MSPEDVSTALEDSANMMAGTPRQWTRTIPVSRRARFEIRAAHSGER